MCQLQLFLSVVVIGNINSQTFETVNVPEIDIGEFIFGSNELKLQISQEFDKAFHEWGAVRLINHSIPLRVTSNLFDGAAQFFDQNLEYKSKYQFGSKQASPGYSPIGTEITENYKNTVDNVKNAKIDIVESFYVFNNWDNITNVDIQSGNIYVPKYSQLPSDFKYFIPEYWINYRELTQNLHSLASMALGFEENNNIFEQNMTENCLLGLRLSNYPEISSSENGIRFGAHQDYTGFTFIQTDPNSTSGLQIYAKNKWYNVEPKYDSILFIGGEFIERWTNYHWVSSLHRVIYNKQNFDKRRISIIVFTSPNMNIDIDVLPCKQCTKHERKFEVMNGFDFINKRIAAASYSSQSNTDSIEQTDVMSNFDRNQAAKTDL